MATEQKYKISMGYKKQVQYGTCFAPFSSDIQLKKSK
jgi:hypothetical protein